MPPDNAVVLSEVLKRFGTVVAVDHVSIQIHDGEFFSLLGPSGCGKTTTLRMIAGFESPTSGEIYIGGMLQSDRPAYQRPVNTVFQHYALFPHMTVAQNVSFGLEMKGVASKEIRRQVGEALDMVQMSGMEERRPIQLSGGQQQRVALARALINRPKVLLLDEPLGSLDLKLRKAMQVELKTLQNQVGITFIYVTHDQEEAMIMSDRIGVMKDGIVLQVDTPVEIYEQPRNRFVADFIGETNFIPGQVRNLGQPIVVNLPGGFQVPAGIAEEGIRPGDLVVVSVRPEKLHLLAHDQSPLRQDQITARLRGIVVQVIYIGTDTRYVVMLDGGVNLVARMQNVNGTETRFHSGDSVEVHWEAHHARVLKE